MAVPILETGFTETGLLGNSTSITVNAPSNIAVDDILIFCLSTDGNSTAHTFPTDFTSLLGVNGIKGALNRCTLAVAWKRAVSADESAVDYTTSWTGNETAYAFMFRISGVNTGDDPEDLGQLASQSSSTITIDPTTPANTDTLVLCFFAADDDDQTTDGGYDAQYTGLTSDASLAGNNNCSGACQHRDEVTPTDPPICDWTLNASEEGAAFALGVTGGSPAGAPTFLFPQINNSGAII